MPLPKQGDTGETGEAVDASPGAFFARLEAFQLRVNLIAGLYRVSNLFLGHLSSPVGTVDQPPTSILTRFILFYSLLTAHTESPISD